MSSVVSLLIPTRSDSSLIDDLIRSAIENAYNLDNVEIIVSLSDTDTVDRWFKDKVKIVRNDKSKGRLGLHEYYNSMAKVATGGLLWLLCDDFRIKTKYYDLILSGLVNFFSRIYWFLPKGGNISGNTCPLITRRWYQVVDRIADWWIADCWLMKLAESLPESRRNNYVPIIVDDVTLIDNLSTDEVNKLRPDKDFKESNVQVPFEQVEGEIKKDATLLLNAIKEGQ